MTWICHRIYLAAHTGWIMPRPVRKMIARSEFHRAWLSGSDGRFVQDGIAYGPAHPYSTS